MAGTGTTQETGSQGPTMMAVMWTMTSLALALVAARLCVRVRLLRNFGLDDWLIGLSMIFGLVFVATATVSVAYGYGQHQSDLSPEAAEKALLWNVISFIFGIVSFALPKLAVAALLHRIMNPTFLQRTIMWGLVSMVSVIAIVNILIYITSCSPPQALWKPTMVANGTGTCRSVWVLIDFATFNGAFSAFVDLYLAIYPGVILFRLQMSIRKKIALTAALGLGSAAAACAMVKCAQLKGLTDVADSTYGAVSLVIWTNVEADVVVMAACIPTLQPILEIILRKLRLVSTGKGTYHLDQYQNNRSYPAQGNSTVASAKKPIQFTKMGSQESILDQDQLQIRRTDEVQIEYETQSQSDTHHHGSFT
ncbi:uncharacterized protein N7459_002946 [Penicillium hispanicum]|uniref:uncharacterized protein n=1 Tax=Penicillium hispanicum TaxID=1080232 RepID=UPI0025419809|nr:uncharacterized protein N7459_002946 [Penicillium hispanicum]KAJ5587181.1 hypothetical protein N7459_002946 [Penicillium hispanicum]